MKLLQIIALSGTLFLAACGAGTNVGQFIDAATAPIANPVKPTNIYQVKLAFNLTVKGANRWASYCWSKTYRALMVDPIGSRVCKDRRETRRKLSEAGDNVIDKIKKADAFVRSNPTFSPIDVIDDAWRAFTDYQSLVKRFDP